MSESHKFSQGDQVVVYSTQPGNFYARPARVTKVHKNGNVILDRDFSRQWRQTGCMAGRNNWERLRIVPADSEEGQRKLTLCEVHDLASGIALAADRVRRLGPHALIEEVEELRTVSAALGGILGRCSE